MKKVLWTEEKIKIGFERFLHEFGHIPSAHEVDLTRYLPSSRFIQMRFGGLEKLRHSLGYLNTHLGKGVFRSEIASMSNLRGRNSELALEQMLIDKFGEVFVHTEKMFSTLKNRVDFYVYTPDGNFGVDVFYTNHMKSLQCNVNIKMSKYTNFTEPMYFVVANKELSQEELDRYSEHKKNAFSENIKLVALDTFINLIQGMDTYATPVRNSKK